MRVHINPHSALAAADPRFHDDYGANYDELFRYLQAKHDECLTEKLKRHSIKISLLLTVVLAEMWGIISPTDSSKNRKADQRKAATALRHSMLLAVT